MTSDFLEWDILDHKFCLWDRDLKTGRIGLSPNFLDYLGFKFDEYLTGQEWFISLIHPEDLIMVSTHMGAHLSGRENHEGFSFRLRTRHAAFMSFKSKGMIVMLSDNGSPVHLYWACEKQE